MDTTIIARRKKTKPTLKPYAEAGYKWVVYYAGEEGTRLKRKFAQKCDAQSFYNDKLVEVENLGTRIRCLAFCCGERWRVSPAAPFSGRSGHRCCMRSLALLPSHSRRRGRRIQRDLSSTARGVVSFLESYTIPRFTPLRVIRVHHGLSLEEAQNIVDAIAVRRLPDIWEVAGKKRVLREGLQAKDEALLLLYSAKDSAVLTEDLISWVEYSNPGVFRAKVLRPLHKARLIEWDRETETLTLSPKGAAYVEETVLD